MNKKIGILTYHRAQNFGALLQVFALQHAIWQEGGNGEIINYICEGFIKDDSRRHPGKDRLWHG